jgi:hypothetical protein
MTAPYWLLYEDTSIDEAGPYSDIHFCRNHAVADASDLGIRVQIHKGLMIDDCIWDSPSMVEEW